jgi:arsenate reductase
VDISGQAPNIIDELPEEDFDYVITPCGHANGSCPAFPGGAKKKIHAGLDNPPALTKGARTEEDALVHYRRVRDEIRAFIERLPETVPALNHSNSVLEEGS